MSFETFRNALPDQPDQAMLIIKKSMALDPAKAEKIHKSAHDQIMALKNVIEANEADGKTDHKDVQSAIRAIEQSEALKDRFVSYFSLENYVLLDEDHREAFRRTLAKYQSKRREAMETRYSKLLDRLIKIQPPTLESEEQISLDDIKKALRTELEQIVEELQGADAHPEKDFSGHATRKSQLEQELQEIQEYEEIGDSREEIVQIQKELRSIDLQREKMDDFEYENGFSYTSACIESVMILLTFIDRGENASEKQRRLGQYKKALTSQELRFGESDSKSFLEADAKHAIEKYIKKYNREHFKKDAFGTLRDGNGLPAEKFSIFDPKHFEIIIDMLAANKEEK